MKSTSKTRIGCTLTLLLTAMCHAETPAEHTHTIPAPTEQIPAVTREDIVKNALLHVYCKRNTECMKIVARLLKPFSDTEAQEFGNPMDVHLDISDDKEIEALEIQINPHVATRINEETIPERIVAWVVKNATSPCPACFYQEQEKTSDIRSGFINLVDIPENTSLDTYSQKYNAEKGTLKVTIPFKKN